MSWRRLVKQLAQRAKAHIEAKGMEKSVEDFRKKREALKNTAGFTQGFKKTHEVKK